MDELTFTLTKQDYEDLRMALEAANIQGPLGAVRKIVVRLTVLRQKLEQQYEHSTSGQPEEHGEGRDNGNVDATSDSQVA